MHVARGGGAAAWIDAEHAFDRPFAAQRGSDVSRLPVATPDSAEPAGRIASRLLSSGALDRVVIDSAAALVRESGDGGRHWAKPTRKPRSSLRAAQAGGGRGQQRSRGPHPQPDAHPEKPRGRRCGNQRRRPGPEVILGCAGCHGCRRQNRPVLPRKKNSLGEAFATLDLQWTDGRDSRNAHETGLQEA